MAAGRVSGDASGGGEAQPTRAGASLPTQARGASRPAGPVVLALDVGGTKVLGGVVTAEGQVLHKAQVATDASIGAAAFLNWLEGFGRDLLEQASVSGLVAVGVSAPGLVDAHRGVMTYGPHTGWRDVPFGPHLAQAFGVPAGVHNDVNACALAEMAFGVAVGVSEFVWVTVSTGIGGAVVIRGELYLGSAGIAGEFGHLRVAGCYPGIGSSGEAPLCDCGNRGCLEAVASGSAIARRGRALLAGQGNGSGNRSGDTTAETVTAEGLAALAYGGNAQALQAFTEAGSYLGVGLSMVANVLNPSLIVIGGGVSRSLDLMLPSARESLKAHSIGQSNQGVPVVQTGLGYEAGLMGAAAAGLAAHRRQAR